MSKFSESKLNHSCSISGPSAISQPIATKKSATSSIRVSKGVASSHRATRSRQRHVHGLLDQHTSLMLSGENGLARLERVSQSLARLSKVLTGETALRGFE